MRFEPVEDSAFKFLGRDFVRSSVNRARYFPDNDIRRIVCLNFVGVKRRDVAVAQTVDQHYGSPRFFDGALGRCLFHIQTVAKADIEKSRIDGGTKECTAEPWPGVEFA